MATPHGPLGNHTKEQLLAQVEELLRSMPARDALRYEESSLLWLGRLKAVIGAWSLPSTVELHRYLLSARDVIASEADEAYDGMLMLLHEAHLDLTMQLPGSTSAVVPQHARHDFFEALRKVEEMAKKEIFFVDPYLDAEFVARFLPHVSSGVEVRLLGRHKTAALAAAVEAFSQQHGTTVTIRSSDALHGRYVFIDGRGGYQCSESFKDGAKNASTTLTEIVETLGPTLTTYEDIWGAAKVVR